MKDEKLKRLYDGVTDIRDDIIEEAEETASVKKKRIWIRWMAAAACVCLAVGGGLYAFMRQGANDAQTPGTGGSGHEEGSVFMSYAGPLLPLTLKDAVQGITAQRNIVFDFEPYRDRTETLEYTEPDGKIVSDTYVTCDRNSVVSDGYMLTNNTDEDVTLTALYPFCGSFADLSEIMPEITVNGEKMDAEWLPGWYAGGFMGVYGDGGFDDTTFNLCKPGEFGDYVSKFEDSEYLEKVFEEYPELNESVIVYEVVNYRADRSNKNKDTNPSLGVRYTESENTTVLSYGFHGMRGFDDGSISRSFSVPKKGFVNDGQTYCMIVLGDDIQNVSLQGYSTLAAEEGNESGGAYGELKRYPSTLGEMLRRLTKEYLSMELDRYFSGSGEESIVPEDVYRGEVARALTEYGILSEHPVDRYDHGMLMEIFSEVNIWDRIMYVTFNVTIPAGQSIDIKAKMIKHASFDFDPVCSGSENIGVHGYDMAVSAGSNLAFSSLTASVEDRGLVEIVRQNFGFDLQKGIRTVELDIKTERYYLEVRKIGS